MSLLNIFTSKSPTMAGYEFDAVLEDTLELSVELTGYTIESGARVSDHRIVNPIRWSIVGAVSNTPIGASLSDFAGGALSNILPNSGIAATVAGLSAGFLAGSSETRSSAALDFLITLTVSGEPFDIDAGDIQLTNMVIANLRRVKDPSNEGGLIFQADLQEYPTLDTKLQSSQPNQSKLNINDPSSTQSSAVNNRGEIRGLAPLPTTITSVSGVLG